MNWASAEEKPRRGKRRREAACGEEGVGRERGRPTGPKAEEGERRKGNSFFSFSNFSKANLKMQIQNNLKFDFKSHHSKIIMQQHECTHMVVNLYLILI